MKEKKVLIKILIKKLKTEPSKEILSLMENISEDALEKLEDSIFEVSSWKDIEEIICG